jgi:hypothetical protein
MRLITTCLVALLGAGASTLVPSPAEEPGSDIAAFAWIAGTWTGVDGKMEMEEVWLAPKGGAMLGLHRDVMGDKMVSFEFLRIATRPNGVAYIASPQGKTATVFLLKDGPEKVASEKRAVFENLENDFPQRILYWLDKDGALHARIEGDKNGKQGPMEWTWRAAGATTRPK